MSPKKPKVSATPDEIIELCTRVMEHKVSYARECAAVMLREFDCEKASLALAEAWANEEDDHVRKSIIISLDGHQNETAKRLIRAIEDEIGNQRGRLKLKLEEPDS